MIDRLVARSAVPRLAWLASALLAVAACERDRAPRPDVTVAPLPGSAASPVVSGLPPGRSGDAASTTQPAPAPETASRPFVPESEPEAPPEAALGNAAEATDANGVVMGPFIVDALVDVAAAGPATAMERGIVMVNRKSELWVARLAVPLGREPSPGATPIGVLPDRAGPFPLGRGPAVRQGFAYWVSRGRLLRQRVASGGGQGAAEVLAEDARVGTRAATPVGPDAVTRALPAMAAYIVRPKQADAPLTAQLWIEGRPAPLPLTDDTTSAHSVALLAGRNGLFALFLEARTGMSSIHLRPIEVEKGAEPRIGEDRVIWVGGPSRPSTELFAANAGGEQATALLPLERDATHFGLALFDLELEPTRETTEPSWIVYANGIEPAPVASASVCGRSVLALARPTSAVPHAPQELVLLDRAEPSRALVVARSKAFFDVSLASVGRAGLLVYVADHRTWARSLRCAS